MSELPLWTRDVLLTPGARLLPVEPPSIAEVWSSPLIAMPSPPPNQQLQQLQQHQLLVSKNQLILPLAFNDVGLLDINSNNGGTSQLLQPPPRPHIYSGLPQLSKDGNSLYDTVPTSSSSSSSSSSTSLSSNPLPSSSTYLFLSHNQSKQAELLMSLQQQVIPELCRVVRELSKEIYVNEKSNYYQGQGSSSSVSSLPTNSSPPLSPFSSPSRSMSPADTSVPYVATLNPSSSLFPRSAPVSIVPTRPTPLSVVSGSAASTTGIGIRTSSSSLPSSSSSSSSSSFLGPISFSSNLTEISVRVKCYSSSSNFYRRKSELLLLVGGRVKIHAQHAAPGKPAVIRFTPIVTEQGGSMPWQEPVESMLFRFLRASLPLLEEMGLDNGE